MDEWQILFGIIASVGVVAGIYFQYRNWKKKESTKEINILVADDNAKASQDNRIHLKSDKEMRDYIEKEMESLSLINADFNQLAQKFIGASIDWIITVDQIEKVDDTNYSVSFSQSSYSRVECFIVDPEEFPIIKFAKKKDKYRIVAQIKDFDSVQVELDGVTLLEKK